MKHLTWTPCLLEDRERFKKHRPLSFSVPDLTDRAPKGVLDGGHPRHTHRPVILRHHRQRNGCEPLLFQGASDQSHGLAAKRSRRSKEHGIHPFSAHSGCHLRQGLFEKDLWIELEPIK